MSSSSSAIGTNMVHCPRSARYSHHLPVSVVSVPVSDVAVSIRWPFASSVRLIDPVDPTLTTMILAPSFGLAGRITVCAAVIFTNKRALGGGYFHDSDGLTVGSVVGARRVRKGTCSASCDVTYQSR